MAEKVKLLKGNATGADRSSSADESVNSVGAITFDTNGNRILLSGVDYAGIRIPNFGKIIGKYSDYIHIVSVKETHDEFVFTYNDTAPDVNLNSILHAVYDGKPVIIDMYRSLPGLRDGRMIHTYFYFISDRPVVTTDDQHYIFDQDSDVTQYANRYTGPGEYSPARAVCLTDLEHWISFEDIYENIGENEEGSNDVHVEIASLSGFVDLADAQYPEEWEEAVTDFFAKLISTIGRVKAQEDINKAVANLVNSAPETLDTLGEIAAVLEDSENGIDAILTALSNKANASDVYNKSQVDTKVSNLQSSINTVSQGVEDNEEVIAAALNDLNDRLISANTAIAANTSNLENLHNKIVDVYVEFNGTIVHGTDYVINPLNNYIDVDNCIFRYKLREGS